MENKCISHYGGVICFLYITSLENVNIWGSWVSRVRVRISSLCHWNAIHLNSWLSLYPNFIYVLVLEFMYVCDTKVGFRAMRLLSRFLVRPAGPGAGRVGVLPGLPAVLPGRPACSPACRLIRQPTHLLSHFHHNTSIYMILFWILPLLMTCSLTPFLSILCAYS